jgi:hypothetical protein
MATLQYRSRPIAILISIWLAGAVLPHAGAAEPGSVVTHHNQVDRSGNFVVPSLTWERARSLHPDANFRAQFSGQVYAQPLYWAPPRPRSPMLLMATEENTVYALDARTGKEVWQRSLGQPVRRSELSCGNIDPLGVTGTPVIDENREAIYLDAAISDEGVHHRIFALSLQEGAPLPGWPIDVADALNGRQLRFNARDQSQRGALLILNGTLYAPFGVASTTAGSWACRSIMRAR